MQSFGLNSCRQHIHRFTQLGTRISNHLHACLLLFFFAAAATVTITTALDAVAVVVVAVVIKSLTTFRTLGFCSMHVFPLACCCCQSAVRGLAHQIKLIRSKRLKFKTRQLNCCQVCLYVCMCLCTSNIFGITFDYV